MARKFVLAAMTAAAVMAAAQATTQGVSAAETIRIETRAFYGATVTMEEGVRVFRPLPAHRRVIINPDGETPLSLGFEDNQFVSRNYNYNYDYGDGSGAGFVGGGVVGGLPFGFGGKDRRRAGKAGDRAGRFGQAARGGRKMRRMSVGRRRKGGRRGGRH